MITLAEYLDTKWIDAIIETAIYESDGLIKKHKREKARVENISSFLTYNKNKDLIEAKERYRKLLTKHSDYRTKE